MLNKANDNRAKESSVDFIWLVKINKILITSVKEKQGYSRTRSLKSILAVYAQSSSIIQRHPVFVWFETHRIGVKLILKTAQLTEVDIY